jgi:hypothetical protein
VDNFVENLLEQSLRARLTRLSLLCLQSRQEKNRNKINALQIIAKDQF